MADLPLFDPTIDCTQGLLSGGAHVAGGLLGKRCSSCCTRRVMGSHDGPLTVCLTVALLTASSALQSWDAGCGRARLARITLVHAC